MIYRINDHIALLIFFVVWLRVRGERGSMAVHATLRHFVRNFEHCRLGDASQSIPASLTITQHSYTALHREAVTNPRFPAERQSESEELWRPREVADESQDSKDPTHWKRACVSIQFILSKACELWGTPHLKVAGRELASTLQVGAATTGL